MKKSTKKIEYENYVKSFQNALHENYLENFILKGYRCSFFFKTIVYN